MKLKRKIKSLKPVIGTWNTSFSPIITNTIAGSGVDFQIIDFEHGPSNYEKIHTLVSTARQHDSGILVRIPSLDSWMVQQSLDQGADGIVFTSINTSEDAKKAQDMCFYPPKGSRGYSPYTSSNNFNSIENKTFTSNVNKSVISVFIIESLESISNLESIIETKPDVIYFGAYDLSKELGFPGDINNPQVIKLVREASRKVLKKRIICGSFVPHTIEDIKFCLKNNLNFVTYSIDTFILTSNLRNASNFLKKN